MTRQEFQDGIRDWCAGPHLDTEPHIYLGISWKQYLAYVRGEFDE